MTKLVHFELGNGTRVAVNPAQVRYIRENGNGSTTINVGGETAVTVSAGYDHAVLMLEGRTE